MVKGDSEELLSNASLKIAVAGVGGGGCNTIKRLVKMGVDGPQLLAVNTDRIHLDTVPAPSKRVLIGGRLTKGLGAGGEPSVAQKAAEASRDVIKESLKGADILFLCAGMGGGTGTGACEVDGVAGTTEQGGTDTGSGLGACGDGGASVRIEPGESGVAVGLLFPEAAGGGACECSAGRQKQRAAGSGIHGSWGGPK